MRALSFVCVLACAAHLVPVVIGQSVCYFRLTADGADDTYSGETQMAADLWTNFLNIAHDDDARAVAIEGSSAELNTIADVIAAKVASCHRAGKRILFNFHAVDGLLDWFFAALLPALFVELRGAPLTANALRAAARPILNLHSCFPPDYDADQHFVESMIAIGLARNRNEYGRWLFGARGGSGNMLAWKTAVALGARGRADILKLIAAHDTVKASCIVQGPELPGGAGFMPHDWITNVLVRRHADTGLEEAQILMHPRFDGTHNSRTYVQKEKCYQGYDHRQTNTNRAVTTSNCIRGVVFGFANTPALRARVGTDGYTDPDWTKTIVEPNEPDAWLQAWRRDNPLPAPAPNRGAARAAIGARYRHDSAQEFATHPLAADPELVRIGVAFPDLANSFRDGLVFGSRKHAINRLYTPIAAPIPVAGRTRRVDLPAAGAMLAVRSRSRAGTDAAHAKVRARIAAAAVTVVVDSGKADDEEDENEAAEEETEEAEAYSDGARN